MNGKLRAIGVAVLAIAASATLMAGSTSATSGGLFHTAPHAKLTLANGATHQLHIINHGVTGELGCATTFYEGTTNAVTVSQVTLVTGHIGCTTTGNGTFIPIDMNGCSFVLTVAAETTSNTEQTLHIACPAGKSIQFTDPNCTISIPAQTASTGTTYTPAVNAKTGKHEITLDTNVQINISRHGLCQFIAPTNGTGTFSGSLTFQARDASGNQVDLTAT
jgi:hypothetical protein